MLVAMLIEDMLSDMGHEIIGPAYSVKEGLKLAERETFDIAILDVNLNGSQSFPVAAILETRGIPFMFATGYGSTGIEKDYPRVPVVSKPFTAARLTAAFARLK